MDGSRHEITERARMPVAFGGTAPPVCVYTISMNTTRTSKKNRGGRPATTRSKSTRQIAYRVSAEQRAELEAEGKRLGIGANAVAKLRAFPRRLAAVVVLALAAAFTSGCVADTGGFQKLSAADQSTFKRCTRQLEPALGCVGMVDVAEFMCVSGGQKTYAAQPTPRARQEWLVANGCPPAMVQPAKYVSEEGGAK